MEDTTVSIIGMIIAIILMFIVPLVIIADRSDDISQLTVGTLTADFVDNVIRVGKITGEDYSNFLISLANSGNTYDVEIEVKMLDENPARVATDLDGNMGTMGQSLYYSIYTSQIEEQLRADRGNEVILLKEGDIISVVAKNNSKTLSQALKSIYYTIAGEDLHIISSTCTGTVAVNGIK